MAKPGERTDLAAALLRQDPFPSEAQYQEYRHMLDKALQRAERRLAWTGRVVIGSALVSLTMLFIGGSKLLGDFDPWSKEATPLSVTAGVVYIVATALFFLSLASYYSRFRPRVRETREQMRDMAILDLQRQLRELRAQLEQRS